MSLWSNSKVSSSQCRGPEIDPWSGCCRNRETKHHTWRAGELRFITLAGPEELTLLALSPEQRGYRVFIHGQAWLSKFSGLQGLGDCKEQDKGKWDKLQFLVLWVPTFWDLRDPDFARSKLSYRGRRSRRLCKILTFPLQTMQPNFKDFISLSKSFLIPTEAIIFIFLVSPFVGS